MNNHCQGTQDRQNYDSFYSSDTIGQGKEKTSKTTVRTAIPADARMYQEARNMAYYTNFQFLNGHGST